MDIMIF